MLYRKISQLPHSFKDTSVLNKFMHEWALAEAVIMTANQIAEKEQLKEVTEVTIRIGELQQVERDVLLFAILELKPEIFKNSKFKILTAKTKLKCRICGNIWQFQKEKFDENTREAIHFIPEVAHSFVKCPNCASPDFEIVVGRGIWLEKIKGAK